MRKKDDWKSWLESPVLLIIYDEGLMKLSWPPNLIIPVQRNVDPYLILHVLMDEIL